MDLLKGMIQRHEGLRLMPYKDTEGYLTVGYGHKIEGSKITPEIADLLLEMDLYRVSLDFLKLPLQVIRNLNQSRKRVVMSMLFNLGYTRFLGFKKMLHAIEVRDFNHAANEMLDSKWAGQVGQRAIKLAQIMRSGEM